MKKEYMMAMFLVGVVAFSTGVNASACGGLQTSISGTLRCPLSYYARDCCWTILAPPSWRICLSITTSDLPSYQTSHQTSEACSNHVFSTYKGYPGPSAMLLDRRCAGNLTTGSTCYPDVYVISVCYTSAHSDDNDYLACTINYKSVRK